MIVTTAQFFKHAYGKYAVGAYNINNAEQAMGLFKGCITSQAPFIIQISKGARKYTDKRMLEAIIRAADTIFPEAIFAVHLDHGDEETCYDCINSGFYSSVMIDASHDPFDQNVAITKRVVDAAHKKGISVEAELGMLGGVEEDIKVEDGNACLTDPDEAKNFVALTGCGLVSPARSAPRTARSSSRASNRCTSTSSKRSRTASPDTRSSCTGHPPSRRMRSTASTPRAAPSRTRWGRPERVPARRQAGRHQDQHRHRRPPRLDPRAPRVLPRQGGRLRFPSAG
jgi:hypothetical protein